MIKSSSQQKILTNNLLYFMFIILVMLSVDSRAQNNNVCPCDCTQAALTQACLASESILVFEKVSVL